jgi:hypothetical protein
MGMWTWTWTWTWTWCGVEWLLAAALVPCACEVTSNLRLDTDASPGGFSYYSLVIGTGATLNVIGSKPLSSPTSITKSKS